MTALPPQAVTAAREAHAIPATSTVHAMEAALEAAAPFIAATERERIRQLAIRKRAVYCKACDGGPCGYEDELAPFADLLAPL